MTHPLHPIGGRRFWGVAAAIAFIALGTIFVSYHRLTRPDAVVPVVTLTGPSDAAPGETVSYVVLVRDRWGAALPNARVALGFARYGVTELGHGTTGDGGEVTIPVRIPDDFDEDRILLASADVGTAVGSDAETVSPRRPGHGTVFVTTDKPLYQPGQTIHIRGLAMADGKPIAGRSATIEVRTEDGTKVFRVQKTTSEFGVVSADFVLADQVKLGVYGIGVSTSVPAPKRKNGSTSSDSEIRSSGSREVEVKRYTLPKLKVELEDLSPLHAGEPFTGKVHATWMFGDPVTKGKVAVSFNGASSNGSLDRDGYYRFEIPPAKASGTLTLSARLSLDDGTSYAANTTVTARNRSAIKLEAFPESGALVEGHAQTVWIATTEAPIPGLRVRVRGGQTEAKTDERGIAKLMVTPPVTPKDKTPVAVEIVAGGEDGSEGKLDLASRSDALIIRPDRDAYRAGEEARVRVLGAKSGDRISVRMTKGSEPVALGSCAVADEPTGCEMTFALPKSVSGLVWLHALSLPGSRGPMKIGKRLVLAAGGSRDLDLKLTTDKPVHAPRADGIVDVAVTGAGGTPVKAQLGVAVADEAVFALAQVRPDLEKVFFTIDQDVGMTRGGARDPRTGQIYRSSADISLPAHLEASTAYDPGAAEDVRSVILAVLSAGPDVGAARVSKSSELESRVRQAVTDGSERLAGWLELVLAVLSVAAFACFGIYGAARLRGAEPAEDGETLRLELRALYTDWLVAILGPPCLAIAGVLASDLYGYGPRVETVVGSWTALTLFCAAFLLVRGVLRVRRTAVSQQAADLRRAIVFLPFAAFFGHAAVLLATLDQTRRLGVLFDVPRDAVVVPLVVVVAAQLSFGFLSVVRATLLGSVTRKRRIWLLASRAVFLGLPVSIGLLVWLVVAHVKARRVSWEEYAQEQWQTEESSASSDNKEGGTGTRAKGEEGSMGNPNPRGGEAPRYGVRGPSDNPSRPVITRDSFPETLLWAPDVVTDESGHAKVTIPFADSITTWRFGVKAVSREGQLGAATLPLVVKQDFFVDATLPAVLVQGDEIALPVTVFSYLPSAQDVSLTIVGNGFSAVGKAETTLHLEPGEARGFRFTVRADGAGDRTVRVQAVGPTRSDALERKVVVVPNGIALTRTVNARASAPVRAVFPAKAIEGGNDLFLKIYGGPLSQVSEGLDGVFQMPHGCFEQTSSVTYPSILALDFLQRTKTVSPDIERRARDYIATGVQRLLSFEVSGSGFSLFGKAPASTTLSAYGLMEFAAAARVADVDPQVLARTRSWLHSERLPSGGWARSTYGDKKSATEDLLTTAWVAWSLASVALPNDPKFEKDRLASVLDVVARMSGPEADDAYALTLRAQALLAGGETDRARPLLDKLAALAVRDDGGVHWASKATGVMSSTGESLTIETTGLASNALARAGRDQELRNGALDWLVTRRGSNGTWSTTPATVAAMRALLDEAKPTPKGPQDVELRVDGAVAETFRLEPTARDVHRLVNLRKWASTGEHTIEVRTASDADISYQVVVRHWVPWQKTAGASQLAFDVGYSPAVVNTGSTLTARVRLGWSGAEPARMPIAEIAIPPAFEVETSDLDKLVDAPPQANGASPKISRYTLERGKLTLYLVELARATPLVFDIPLRALRPAKVRAPSSTAYLYYEPEIRAETAPAIVQAQ